MKILKLLCTTSAVALLSASVSLAQAAVAVNVQIPNGTNDTTHLQTALNNSAIQPVQLALDPAHPNRRFNCTSTLSIPAHGTLLAIQTSDVGGDVPPLALNCTISLAGDHATADHVAVAGAPGNGFQIDNNANYVVCRECIAVNNGNDGFYANANGSQLLNPHIYGGRFFNNANRGIELVNGVSDIVIDQNTNVGTNCRSTGCDGDVFLWSVNGQVNSMRIEWSWGAGIYVTEASEITFDNDYFDRTGSQCMTIQASAVVITGGSCAGYGRAGTPQYSGPGLLIQQDQFGHPSYVHESGMQIAQWGPAASYVGTGQCFFNPCFTAVMEFDGNGVQPTPYGVYADQATHDLISQYVIAPPALPQ
jgi:hypothetical protein